MSRSLFLRVVLSLMLLISQQQALTHAMSHWTGTADQTAQLQADGNPAPAKGNLHDAGCAQCLSFAQLASAVGSPSYAIALLDIAAMHQSAAIPSADCIRTVCVFQSRAPPLA